MVAKSETEWQGRDAANTLAEAERIKKDPKLYKQAKQYADKMAKEHEQTATNLRSAVSSDKKTTIKKTTASSKSSPKTTAKPTKKK